MNLFLFIIVNVGIVNILQNENIFSFFREYLHKNYPKIYNFYKCPSCLSFWVGVIISFIIPIHSILFFNMFFGGVVSSICNKIYKDIFREKFELI